MTKSIYSILLAVIFLFNLTPASAYNPSVNTTTIPYQVYTADSLIETRAEYLGELKGDPQMYEFTIGADTKLSARVWQLETGNPIPFSIIAVRQNNQNAGVAEVGRLKANEIVWEKTRDSVLGLSFLKSKAFESEIGPGIYRIEVSTPDNVGKYMLTIGEKRVSSGYFGTLAEVRKIQSFFGKSIFAIFTSSYIYYPLGIVILSVLIFITWRKRELIKSKHA